MKTWVLVWFLIFPPTGPNKDVTWVYNHQGNMTEQECYDLLEEKDTMLKHKALAGDIVGHEVHCKELK